LDHMKGVSMSMKLLKLAGTFLLPFSLSIFADDAKVESPQVTSLTNCLKQSKSSGGISYDKCMALKTKDILLKLFNPNDDETIHGNYCGFNEAFYRDNTTETHAEKMKKFHSVKRHIYNVKEALQEEKEVNWSQYPQDTDEMKTKLMINYFSVLHKLGKSPEGFLKEAKLDKLHKFCKEGEANCDDKIEFPITTLPVTFTQDKNEYGLDTFCFYQANCIFRKDNVVDIDCDKKFTAILGDVYAQILEENISNDNNEMIDDAAVREIVALMYVTYQAKVFIEQGLGLVTDKNIKLSPEQLESVGKYANLVADAIENFGIDHIVSAKIGTWAPVFNQYAAQYSGVFKGISYAASYIPTVLSYLPELNKLTGGALMTLATAVITYGIKKCKGRASGGSEHPKAE